MWTCVRCAAELSVDDAPPAIDDFGIYFLCPKCGRRNRVVNIGGEDDAIVLLQPDEPD